MICELSNCECIAAGISFVSTIVAIGIAISNGKKISENQKIALMDKRIPLLEDLIKKYKDLFILCNELTIQDIDFGFINKFKGIYADLMYTNESNIASQLMLGDEIFVIIDKIDEVVKSIFELIPEQTADSSFDKNAVLQKINRINVLRKNFVTEISKIFLIDNRAYSKKFEVFLDDEFLKKVVDELSGV